MLLVKFYPHQFSSDVIAQREIISKVEIDYNLVDFWIANLRIPITDGVEEDTKIEIYEVGLNSDTRVFTGFIYEIRPVRRQFQMMDIVARTEKAIMQKRKSLQGFNFQNTPIKNVIQWILNQFSVYNDDRSTEVRFNWDFTIEVKKSDTIFDVFDEIAENTQSFWDIVDWKVIFAKEIGVHKPTEIVFDWFASNPWNITEVQSTGTATSCNIVIVEDRNWNTSTNSDFFDWFLRGIWNVGVRNGNIVESAEIQAKKLSKPQRNFQIGVATGSFEANVGDYVNVDIKNTNKYFNFKGEAIVAGKTVIYDNAQKIVSYTIWEFAVYPFSSIQRQKDVNKSIRLLNLKDIS